MKMVVQLESSPFQLELTASGTQQKVTRLEKNPEKFLLGRINFINGSLEYYVYRKKTDVVFSVLSQRPFSKSSVMHIDKRRIKEIRAVTRRVHYYLSLSGERRSIYLQNHGAFANINIGEDKA